MSAKSWSLYMKSQFLTSNPPWSINARFETHKHNDTPFSCKECHLVQAGLGQLAQLDSPDLSTDAGRDVLNLGPRFKNGWFGAICTSPGLFGFEVGHIERGLKTIGPRGQVCRVERLGGHIQVYGSSALRASLVVGLVTGGRCLPRLLLCMIPALVSTVSRYVLALICLAG